MSRLSERELDELSGQIVAAFEVLGQLADLSTRPANFLARSVTILRRHVRGRYATVREFLADEEMEAIGLREGTLLRLRWIEKSISALEASGVFAVPPPDDWRNWGKRGGPR